MRALIADDDRLVTGALSHVVGKWGLEATVAHNGIDAWYQLMADPAPSLAIVDWMMPGIDGLEICRRVRNEPTRSHLYLLLLTSRETRGDIVAGLDAGADDYVVKPFNLDELRARVQVGIRVANLQERLAEQVRELRIALTNVRQLRGLLPICSYCKRIRNDQNYWEQVEQYVTEHSDAKFTHGICPTCLDTVRAEMNSSPKQP